MATPDACSRLILKIARARAVRAHLHALLGSADSALAAYRQELRTLKARTARRSPGLAAARDQ